MADLVYPPVVTLARAVFKVQGIRFDLRGTENVPRTGGAVLCLNHVGYLDFTYAGMAARRAGRLVRFMAKDQVFRHRISGPLMRGMHHIPVDRDAGAGSYRAAVLALRAGEIVGVFPEATISRSFELKDFKAGAVRMAQEAGVPVLPAVIWGSQRVWTKGLPKRLGRTRAAISVWVGEPLHADPAEDSAAVTEVVRGQMIEMLHAVQAAYPDQPTGPEDTWWQPARLGGGAPSPEAAAQLDRDERRARIAAAKAARDRDRAR